MDRLPPELLAQVFSLSSIKSLKKIRLVNTTFAQIAAQYLFEALCTTLIPEYLDKVTEVAFHPTLRFHVRTLYFDGDILNEDYADYEKWEAAIDTRDPDNCYVKGAIDGATIEGTSTEHRELPRWQCSQADLDRSHTNFCRLLSAQKTLFDGRMDLVILSAAFAKLPNLGTIEPINYSVIAGTRATPYDSIKGHDTNWIPILSNLQRDTLLPKPFVDLYVSTRLGLARPLASLFAGLGVTRQQVLTMELSEIPWAFWEQDGPSGFQHGAQQFIHAAFRQLEYLDVIFLVDAHDLWTRLQGVLPLSINSFIEAAPSLRQLHLDFHYHEHDRANVAGTDWLWNLARAGQLFATLTLANLARFSVKSCTLTEAILIGFMRRHTATLKDLCITDVTLDDDSIESTSWEKTLKQIAPILSLDGITLSYLQSDDIENVIEAEDPDFEASESRIEAYCQCLEEFLRQRGQTDCPKILDFARPAG